LKRSTTFSRLFEKNKLDGAIKRPLLPLNLGQVGLIGGSGLINGLVECDSPHIIKGRIVKENRLNKEENLNKKGELTSTTVIETRSNKMIFNLLTPHGFMSLADYGNSTNADADNDEYSPSGRMSVATAVAVATRVPLGRTVITANASNILSDTDIDAALARHQAGDWGEVCESDWKTNDDAIKNGFRILSAYTSTDDDKFWVITEADRSCTTVLMPDDY
jgi:hypothetical protein